MGVVACGRPAEFVPTIIVSDDPRGAPSSGLSSTVITVGRQSGDAVPDIAFEQTSPSAVRVSGEW